MHAVQRRILSSANIASQGITVTVHDGKVTLRGTVDSYVEVQQAGFLAAETDGVTGVENLLRAEWKAKRSDQSIKADLVAALDLDVYLSGQDIGVGVSEGTVILAGSVGNAYEKDKATDVAWSVANVKSVDNKLEVVWRKDRGTRAEVMHLTDAELKQAVIDELKQDGRLNADEVSVEVSFGRVTLNGSVTNNYQRRIAEQDVRDVIGVGWVTNNLFSEIDKRADWLVKTDVEFVLDTDFALAGFDIEGGVKDGVVTLSGDVHNWYEKARARQLTLGVKGVRKVINKIGVHYVAPKSDAELAKDVASRLMWDWTTFSVYGDISVTVKNGVAKLTGEVDTWGERNAAGSIAFKTHGIWRVQNHLTVKGYVYRWDEWLDDDGIYIYDPYYDAYGLWPYYYDGEHGYYQRIW